jgi:hypothetical protein
LHLLPRANALIDVKSDETRRAPKTDVTRIGRPAPARMMEIDVVVAGSRYRCRSVRDLPQISRHPLDPKEDLIVVAAVHAADRIMSTGLVEERSRWRN